MFFGSDDFSLASLKEIFKSQNELVNKLQVVTLAHKKNPVRQFAENNKIDVQEWPPKLTDPFDLGVVVSFGRLIPAEIINHFPLGIINIHASLLPRWRGGTPIIHSMINGDTVTGISIMQIKPEKFDIGGIIMQKPIEIGPTELMPELRDRLAKLGADCLIDTLKTLPECLKSMKEQSNENVSFAPRISKTIANISWSDMTASQIYNRYRALYSVYHLKTTFNGKPLKLNEVKSLGSEELFRLKNVFPDMEPGFVEYSWKSQVLVVQCKDSPVFVSSVRFNQKVLSATDFHGGYLCKMPKSEWRFL